MSDEQGKADKPEKEKEKKKEQEIEQEEAPIARPGSALATGGEAAALEMESDGATNSSGGSPARPRDRGSSAIAWLALLLVLALGGAAGWSLMEFQRREVALLDRLTDLEVIAARKEANLDELSKDWSRQLESGLGSLRAESSQQVQTLQAMEAELAEQRAEMAEQRQELARYGANDRDSWLLAEAEYLLRLANQRLVMTGDTIAARALLSTADEILRDMDDASLHEVRGAIAADMAAVRAVPRLDVEGLYLRLSALIEQAGELVIFQMPEAEEQPQEGPAEDWQARLRQGYEDALLKLSNYIVIRRRDVPMRALMDPQWEGLVRQNLRMLLEQAQVALLSGNQPLYRESLERARHWVGEFFESDGEAARAMAREITELADSEVAVSLPDITRSLQAMDDAMGQRLQRGGDV